MRAVSVIMFFIVKSSLSLFGCVVFLDLYIYYHTLTYSSIPFFNFFEFSFVKKLVLKVYNSLIDFLVFVCYNIVKWGSIIIIIVGHNKTACIRP